MVQLTESSIMSNTVVMTEAKALLASRTFWGAAVSLGAAALSLGHYTVTAADQASLVEVFTSIAAGVGGAVAIYGRVKATRQITSMLPK